MAEIVPVVSESLEAQVRNLLPSQRGFGEDLQASNVILPIIDLTAAAQGSQIPTLLQTALAFGSQTAFDAEGSTVVLTSTPGFYRIIGTVSLRPAGAITIFGSFTMTDGLSSKTIYKCETTTQANESSLSESYDFVVFVRQGESVSAVSNNAQAINTGSFRQIADVNGNLVYPVGFSPQ